MIEPTATTWVLSVIGVIIYLPAVYIQARAVFRPRARATKDLLVGRGEEYPDVSYVSFCRGSGWADLGLQIPLVIVGSVGVLFGRPWAYALWFAGVSITLYVHLILLFLEGKHIFTKWGPLAFFTYGWGLWAYYALVVAVYCLARLAGMSV